MRSNKINVDCFAPFIKRTALHYLRERFLDMGVFNPELEDLLLITENDLIYSWLSMPSQKQILLLQQTLKPNK